MFRFTGRYVSRFWAVSLIVWIGVLAALVAVSPRWESVTDTGEFAYLPEDVPSHQGELVFQEAFGANTAENGDKDLLGSSIVVVVRRKYRDEGLMEEDLAFIEQVLEPRIELVGRLSQVATFYGVTDDDREAVYEKLSTLFGKAWEANHARSAGEEEPPAANIALTVARDWLGDLLSAEAAALRDRISEAEETEREALQKHVESLERRAEELADEPGGDETTVETSLAERFRAHAAALDADESSALGELVGSSALAFAQEPQVPRSPPNRLDPVVVSVRTRDDKEIGKLLDSDDGKATLVIVELATEFMDIRNFPTIWRIEDLLEELQREEPATQGGRQVVVSGIAVVGRDMIMAAKESADSTELWTVVLVVILLLLIYRTPVLAAIPLVTVGVAREIALHLLALLADWGLVQLFAGIEIYVTVVLYGAGVDYCLFLIARYKEELDAGASYDEAAENAVTMVGSALAASAGTTMCGIGMMYFAQFGKFSQAGIAIPFGLGVVLLASMTFTPALLRFAGRWAFWPQVLSESASSGAWLSPTSAVSRMLRSDWIGRFWERTGESVEKRPGFYWLGCVAIMAPFAVVGVTNHDHLSYGLLSELPKDSPSVVGAEAVQEHFPAGATGPVTVLMESDESVFDSREGRNAVKELTERLERRQSELNIADVRSQSSPLGLEYSASDVGFLKYRLAQKYYVSEAEGLDGKVARLDVVFEHDPFARDSIDHLERFQGEIRKLLTHDLPEAGALPEDVAQEMDVYFVGATPSIRDLKAVTDADQIRIDVLVLAGVFVILVMLLRRPALAGYLILSVFFSYLVTLGITFALFWSLDPSGFAGLDWKVPVFLFTILIAVGEDYNIYLITRVNEEQERHGPVHGITTALSRTGGIISSCGIIMAGTFSSLMTGTLVGMQQLGFALAFGVLLDTFVVRPVLVPAYLVMLNKRRFGVVGRWLGAREEAYESEEEPLTSPVEVGGS